MSLKQHTLEVYRKFVQTVTVEHVAYWETVAEPYQIRTNNPAELLSTLNFFSARNQIYKFGAYEAITLGIVEKINMYQDRYLTFVIMNEGFCLPRFHGELSFIGSGHDHSLVTKLRQFCYKYFDHEIDVADFCLEENQVIMDIKHDGFFNYTKSKSKLTPFFKLLFKFGIKFGYYWDIQPIIVSHGKIFDLRASF